MKLSAYIVRHDSGFSPNPFGGLCTLACCNPVIRCNAEQEDIVIGTGSARSGLSRRLIYAMRVEHVLPFEEYWSRYPSKRPSPTTPAKAEGTISGIVDISDNWCCAPGARHNEGHRKRDLRGRNALISHQFYYYGGDAINIPARFHCLIASTQGHKNTENAHLITGFWKWVTEDAPKLGRIGLPCDFAEPGCGCNRNAEH
jgi:hypothetical protein